MMFRTRIRRNINAVDLWITWIKTMIAPKQHHHISHCRHHLHIYQFLLKRRQRYLCELMVWVFVVAYYCCCRCCWCCVVAVFVVALSCYMDLGSVHFQNFSGDIPITIWSNILCFFLLLSFFLFHCLQPNKTELHTKQKKWETKIKSSYKRTIICTLLSPYIGFIVLIVWLCICICFGFLHTIPSNVLLNFHNRYYC